MAQMNLSTEMKQIYGLGEQTCGYKGGGRGEVGWAGSLRLVDTNYCIWSGQAMRSCFITQGTISSHLWWNMMDDNVRKTIYIYTHTHKHAYMCMTGSLCSTAELTEHCKSTII